VSQPAAWGESPWRVALELERPPLPAHCEVAVVGAGFTGLTAAYTLARRGANVAVFEAAELGSGASGRTGGIVLEGSADGPLPESDACIPALQRILDETALDCDLELPGCWELRHSERDTPLWRDGERNLHVHESVPGGTLDPGKLLAGLATAALDAKTRLYESAAVTQIAGGGPLVLRVCDQDVRADHVVLGLNAYTSSVVSVGEDFHPALTLAMSTEPLAPGTLDAIGLEARRPFYTIDLPYLWGRPLGEDRLIFGGGLAFDVSKRVDRIDLRSQEVALSLARLEDRVRALHPALAQVRIRERWGGPVAFRANRRPILCRHPSLPGLILSGAYAGHGVALSVRVGEILASAILTDRALPGWGEVDWVSESREIG